MKQIRKKYPRYIYIYSKYHIYMQNKIKLLLYTRVKILQQKD